MSAEQHNLMFHEDFLTECGEVECSCGWESGIKDSIDDATAAAKAHLAEVGA
jgi:hypothetical protein